MTLNCWREARIWVVAGYKAQLPHIDAITQESGLWWYWAFPQLSLDDLFLF